MEFPPRRPLAGALKRVAGVDYPPYLLSRPMTIGSPLPFGLMCAPSVVCCGAQVPSTSFSSGSGGRLHTVSKKGLSRTGTVPRESWAFKNAVGRAPRGQMKTSSSVGENFPCRRGESFVSHLILCCGDAAQSACLLFCVMFIAVSSVSRRSRTRRFDSEYWLVFARLIHIISMRDKFKFEFGRISRNV
jgi:hypothetical protein